MRLKHRTIVVLILAIFYCADSVCQKGAGQHYEFSVAGQVKGFDDSTVLFLDYPPGKIDSTYIVNDGFRFDGKMRSTVENVLIRTRNYSDYKFFWLESKSLTFTAQKGEFRSAAISGSTTQREYDKLTRAIGLLESKIDSLIRVLDLDTLALVDHAAKKKEIDSLQEIRLAVQKRFIKEHPNSVLGIDVLHNAYLFLKKDTVALLFHSLGKTWQVSPKGQEVLNFIKVNQDIKEGGVFADFTQYDTAGQKIKLSDFKGKVVLLNFWASWCVPCRRENVVLKKLYDEYKSKGFEIFGVTVDDYKDNWKKAIIADHITWINGSELDMGVNTPSQIYAVVKYPTNYLIDRNGVIVKADIGVEELGKELETAMK